MWSWFYWVVCCAVLDFFGYFALKTETQTSLVLVVFLVFDPWKNSVSSVSLSLFCTLWLSASTCVVLIGNGSGRLELYCSGSTWLLAIFYHLKKISWTVKTGTHNANFSKVHYSNSEFLGRSVINFLLNDTNLDLISFWTSFLRFWFRSWLLGMTTSKAFLGIMSHRWLILEFCLSWGGWEWAHRQRIMSSAPQKDRNLFIIWTKNITL